MLICCFFVDHYHSPSYIRKLGRSRTVLYFTDLGPVCRKKNLENFLKCRICAFQNSFESVKISSSRRPHYWIEFKHS